MPHSGSLLDACVGHCHCALPRRHPSSLLLVAHHARRLCLRHLGEERVAQVAPHPRRLPDGWRPAHFSAGRAEPATRSDTFLQPSVGARPHPPEGSQSAKRTHRTYWQPASCIAAASHHHRHDTGRERQPQQGHPTNLQGLGCQPHPGHQRTAYRHHLSALHPPGRRQKTMAAHRRTHQRDCHLGIRVPHRPACQCRQGCLNDQHLLFRPAHQTQLDGCEQPDSRCHRDAHHPASPPLRHQLSAVLCRRAVHPVALQAHLQPSACLGHPPQALGLGMGNGGGIGGCPGGNHTAGVLLFRQHRLLFRTQLVCRHSRCHGHHLCQPVAAALVLPPAGILPATRRTGIPAEPHHLCHPACPAADSHAAGSLHRGDKNKHPAIRPHLYCHHCRMLAYSKTSSMPSSPNSSSV